MSLVLKDRVKETTNTTGTGAVTLLGAEKGFQPFSIIGDGNQTYYAIENSTTGDWETGVGTYSASGPTLSRDEVIDSSNSGSLVSFAAGNKSVFCTYPAERAIYEDNLKAGVVSYDNTESGLDADNVQDAINEVTEFFTATVEGSDGTSDWVGSDPSVATLTVAGIKATDIPIVSLDISGETLEDGLMLQREFNLLSRVEASDDDEIKVYAVEEPLFTLNLLIKVVR